MQHSKLCAEDCCGADGMPKERRRILDDHTKTNYALEQEMMHRHLVAAHHLNQHPQQQLYQHTEG